MVKSPEGVLVTQNVHKRITKQAEKHIPKTFRDLMIQPFLLLVIGSEGYLGYEILWPLVKDFDLSWILLAFAILQVGVVAQIIWVARWLEAPRNKKVNEQIDILLKKRQEELDEAERFYSSPEWKKLRMDTIQSNGRTCTSCERLIRRAKDLTVDHIKPRSKFPEFALEMANLQIMCRRCNSRKGAKFED